MKKHLKASFPRLDGGPKAQPTVLRRCLRPNRGREGAVEMRATLYDESIFRKNAYVTHRELVRHDVAVCRVGAEQA